MLLVSYCYGLFADGANRQCKGLSRTLAMPKPAEPWSLTSLREKLIKIGAKVVSHGRYVTFQMAEVAVSRQMFQEILTLIAAADAARASVKCRKRIDRQTTEEVRPDRSRAFQRLGTIDWRFRPSFMALEGGSTFSRMPEGVIMTLQPPGIRRMSE